MPLEEELPDERDPLYVLVEDVRVLLVAVLLVGRLTVELVERVVPLVERVVPLVERVVLPVERVVLAVELLEVRVVLAVGEDERVTVALVERVAVAVVADEAEVREAVDSGVRAVGAEARVAAEALRPTGAEVRTPLLALRISRALVIPSLRRVNERSGCCAAYSRRETPWCSS